MSGCYTCRGPRNSGAGTDTEPQGCRRGVNEHGRSVENYVNHDDDDVDNSDDNDRELEVGRRRSLNNASANDYNCYDDG